MTEPWLIAIGTNTFVLIITLWAFSVRATYRLGTFKAEIIASITSHAKEDEAEFSKVRREINRAVIDFGETISAIREEVGKLRLHCSETFVRRDGFWKAMDGLSTNLLSLRSELKADLQRMEQKIDSKT